MMTLLTCSSLLLCYCIGYKRADHNAQQQITALQHLAEQLAEDAKTKQAQVDVLVSALKNAILTMESIKNEQLSL